MRNHNYASKVLLRKSGIELEKGLSLDEIEAIETTYGFSMPYELRDFFMDALPVGSGFYNWRDFSGDNIAYIKRRMMHPFDYAEAHLDEIDWNELWGEEPTDENMRNNVIASRLKTASKLIPLFKHRYVPAIGSEKAVVLSIHGVDAICYGYGLRDYFYREFISNSRPVNISNIPHIPFWDEIM